MTGIVAYDGASTPASHTLALVSVSKDAGTTTAVYREQVEALPLIAQILVTLTSRRLASGVNRVSARIEVPVMESVTNANSAGYTAAPKVAYVDTVEITGFFHERGTIAGRRLARQLAANIFNGIETTVTPVTTKPAGQLFDILAMPLS
jgi:hypothetical protein